MSEKPNIYHAEGFAWTGKPMSEVFPPSPPPTIENYIIIGHIRLPDDRAYREFEMTPDHMYCDPPLTETEETNARGFLEQTFVLRTNPVDDVAVFDYTAAPKQYSYPGFTFAGDIHTPNGSFGNGTTKNPFRE